MRHFVPALRLQAPVATHARGDSGAEIEALEQEIEELLGTILIDTEKDDPMSTAVLVTRYGDNRFTACALALSDVVATGASEAEAITALHAALADLQARSHVVQVDLPVPTAPTDDPWLRVAGIWVDDPSWEAFQQAITEYRSQS